MSYPVEAARPRAAEGDFARRASLDEAADTVADNGSQHSSRRQQRQSTPKLREHSASLTRRQKLLEEQQQQQMHSTTNSRHSSSDPSRSPGEGRQRFQSVDSPDAVGAVRSALPLIPAEEGDSDEVVATVPRSSPRQRLSRRSSPATDSLLAEQRAASADVSPKTAMAKARLAAAGVDALPSPLRAHHHRRTPQGTPGKPPLVRTPPTTAKPTADAHLLSFPSTVSEGEDGDEEEEEPAATNEYPVESPPMNVRGPTAAHKSDNEEDDGDTEAWQEVSTELFKPLIAHEHRSIDGGVPALHEEESEKPIAVDMRHRASRHLANDADTEKGNFHTKPEIAHRASVKPTFDAPDVAPVAATAASAEHDSAPRNVHEGADETPVRVAVRHRRSLHLVNTHANSSSSRNNNAHGLSLHPRREVATQASLSPAAIEVRAAGEREMSAERNQRRSIHGGGSGGELYEEEEQPHVADVRRRSTRVLEEDSDAAARRRRSRLGSLHAQLEQPAVDPCPVSAAQLLPHAMPLRTEESSRRLSRHATSQQAPLFTAKEAQLATMDSVNPRVLEAEDGHTAHTRSSPPAAHTQQQQQQRRSVNAVHEELQRPMPAAKRTVASAPQRTQVDAHHRRASRHAAADGQPWFAAGEEKPAELRTAGPQTMAAAPARFGSADAAHRSHSVHTTVVEHVQQHDAVLQAQPMHVMATSEAQRRASQHATASAVPLFTDADAAPATLKTIIPQKLATKPASAPPRCSFHGRPFCGDELEAHPTQVEKCPARTMSAAAREGLSSTEEVAPTADKRSRSCSRHGALEEGESPPVAPLKATALSQPLRVTDFDANDDELGSDAEGAGGRRPPPRRASLHASERSSVYSPVAPLVHRLPSAALPSPRESMDEDGENRDTPQLRVCISDQSSLSDDSSAAATVPGISERTATSPLGCKYELQERYKRALGDDLPTELPRCGAVDDDVSPVAAPNGAGSNAARQRSLLSHGSVEVARRIRGFYAGETDDEDQDDAADVEDHHRRESRHGASEAEDENAETSAEVCGSQQHRSSISGDASSRTGRLRRATRVTAVDVLPIRASEFSPKEADASADENDARGGDVQGKEADDGDEVYEMISCYDVSCQTSAYLLHDYLDSLTRADAVAKSNVAAATPDNPHYMSTDRWMCALGLCPRCHPSRLAHQANTHRSGSGERRGETSDAAAAAGGRTGSDGSGNAGRIVWPLVTRPSLGYSAPPRLTRSVPPCQRLPPPLVMTTPPRVPASFAATTPTPPPAATRPHPHAPLPYLKPATTTRSSGTIGKAGSRSQPQRPSTSSARFPTTRSAAVTAALLDCSGSSSGRRSHGSTGRRGRDQPGTYTPRVTAYRGGYCFTQEWESRQRQRQRDLRCLQAEQSARQGGGSAAYSPRLLTCHDVQSGQPMSEFAYRYCDLESERMMVHSSAPSCGAARRDVPLENYNDTLQGAPLISRRAGSPVGGSEASVERTPAALAEADAAEAAQAKRIRASAKERRRAADSAVVAAHRCGEGDSSRYAQHQAAQHY
ncbi:hypothetical protein ABB37_06924 [Leptomonas pyrrhocoris]|uniref:Uncharacterized protein n=1 Tax=Leptomonas pyrrhocoris TaxID=157538 RepID=A0A0M9FWS2_LEPPY|nr:hypothetical protein ABB37_06924 [Leptomonas pyrrhocoris]KPA77547.1 hypothetical protein ABB37_06924 [Leptomonas pyrrhocoris]|eukprot:XP_015655986.1 hypothetical protein ABB37_06924 [Leptomonas pyrrhocoris]